MSALIREIMEKIQVELAHQNRKWGKDRILNQGQWITILGEEFGEVCRASLDMDGNNYLDELIDVAATAIHAYQSILLERQRIAAKHTTDATIIASDNRSANV